jgi:very-short-patch-repair endonuclease
MTDKSFELVRDLETKAAAVARDEFRHSYRHMVNRCESPIERMLLAAMIYTFEYDCDWAKNNEFFMSNGDYVYGEFKHPFPHAALFCQAKIGEYRADFVIDALFDFEGRRVFVIECDGHDYHERTKQQAARDRQRDRWMTERGLVVLRFTGSEIYADPLKCSEQIEGMVSAFKYPEIQEHFGT